MSFHMIHKAKYAFYNHSTEKLWKAECLKLYVQQGATD